MNEYENYDPYGTYETKGEDPYSILLKMAAWNKGLRSTISDVKVTLDGTIARQSQIIQEVDNITLNVTDIETNLTGVTTQVGQLEVRSDQITQNVLAIDSRVGWAESTINVQAGQIQNKVGVSDFNGNTIASLINQTATTVTVIASKIELSGITEVAHTLNIGGNFRDTSSKSINFRGTSGGVAIYSNQTDDLAIAAVNRVDFNTPTINFNNAELTNFRGVKAYLSHQSGLTMEVTATGMIVRTPSGTTKTFTAV